MQHSFSAIPKADIQRSQFDRSFSHKTTFASGRLIPIYVDEVLPGDTVNLAMSAVIRSVSPWVVPVMDNTYLDVQFFFVPCRLVWSNWQKFMGEVEDPDEAQYSTGYSVPYFVSGFSSGDTITTNNFKRGYGTGNNCVIPGDLAAFMGVPLGCYYFPSGSTDSDTSSHGYYLNSLPLRAYNLIWNEWYRDENLQSKREVQWDSDTTEINTENASDWLVTAYRGKRHDYFTSCLPFPQKGPGVELSLGTSAALAGSLTIPASSISVSSFIYDSDGNAVSAASGTNSQASLSAVAYDSEDNSTRYARVNSVDDLSSFILKGSGDVELDLSDQDAQVNLASATAVTINSLRQAFQLQRFYERDARGGTRYTEMLRAHFGVVSPDSRLQRPEYLGGWSQPISQNTVAATVTNDNVAVGDLSTFVLSSSSHKGFTHSFVEHGYIIGLASVRADLTYWQGLSRMWTRQERTDFYFPVFAHLGEQAVLNREIYCAGRTENDSTVGTWNETVFGYQEAWAEYRYKPNMLTGALRVYPEWYTSNVLSSDSSVVPIPQYTLAQEFDTSVALNSTFIRENPPLERVKAVTDVSDWVADFYFRQKWARPMPVYSVPGLVDHF